MDNLKDDNLSLLGSIIGSAAAERLKGIRYNELHTYTAKQLGLTARQHARLCAAVEFGRRVEEGQQAYKKTRIRGSSDAISYCERHFSRLASDAKQEEFHIVTLDTKNQVIDTHQITVGTIDASLVHPREVFRAAIRDAASSILLVHNHPSGDPTPSREDFAVTDRLTSVGEIVGINILDHLILGSRCVSISECRR